MIDYVPFKVEHLDLMYINDEDKAIYKDTNLIYMHELGMNLTCIYNGIPVYAMGVAPICGIEDKGWSWLCPTKFSTKYYKALLPDGLRWFNTWKVTLPYKSFVTTIKSTNAGLKRWMKWMNFKYIKSIEDYDMYELDCGGF